MSNASTPRRLEPVLLLLAAGFCIGLIFPLGRLAGEAGLPPLIFAGASAAGAAIVLGAITLAGGGRLVLERRTLIYAAVAGQLTFAIPFGTLVAVIPHLGSGIPAILQSLAPIVTLAIVLVIGLERPNPIRTLGLATGMAGALIILASRNAGALDVDAPFGWYLAALVTPAALAAGNVYRTTSWPEGSGALPLATLTLAAAALGLGLVLLVQALAGGAAPMGPGLRAGWWLIGLQSLATGIGYAFFFRLQQIGGPVYLSQISYVNTGVGVAFAVLLFGERLSLWIWVAVALVFAGVALVNRTNKAAAGLVSD
ncbi:MAG TPA: DMT family transporter [Bauldia sp.]|nr:DMT family transporter [Bauldia sp.]